MTWTACASVSRRRLRSSSGSVRASRMRSRSHAVRNATPPRFARAAACRASPTWRRSVRWRSPSSRASTRATIPVDPQIRSMRAATPRSASSAAQARMRRARSSSSASGAAARWAALQPTKSVRATARERAGRAGCPRAFSSASHSAAAALRNTLDVPVSTTGTSAAWRASRTSRPSLFFGTSTAMSPGEMARRTSSPRGPERSSTSAPEESSRTMSAATSAAMAGRITPTVIGLSGATPERGSTRIRSGAPTSLPTSVRRAWWASTGRTRISRDPRATPFHSRPRASTRGRSLRQLVPRVSSWAPRVASR